MEEVYAITIKLFGPNPGFTKAELERTVKESLDGVEHYFGEQGLTIDSHEIKVELER